MFVGMDNFFMLAGNLISMTNQYFSVHITTLICVNGHHQTEVLFMMDS